MDIYDIIRQHDAEEYFECFQIEGIFSFWLYDSLLEIKFTGWLSDNFNSTVNLNFCL